jgi:hypothetical protein
VALTTTHHRLPVLTLGAAIRPLGFGTGLYGGWWRFYRSHSEGAVRA